MVSGLGDERADDVGLAPVVEVAAEALVGLGAPLVGDPARDDRLRPRGGPGDLRHVEVAVDRLGERARDRRRGHVQDVGGPASASARRCSTPKRCCSSITATARSSSATPSWMSACVPTRICAPSRLVFHGARLQRDADAELGADRLDGEEVLLGEGLGRRHQGALLAALDGAQEGVEGDDGLPRADVALEQPLHGPFAAEIGVDLGNRLLLLGRERERERLPIAVEELPRLPERRRARLLGERLATADEAELEQEELLEAEAGAGGLGVFEAFGAVHRGDRVGRSGRPSRARSSRRKRVWHAAREGERGLDQRADAVGGQRLGGRRYSGTRPSVCTPAPPSSCRATLKPFRSRVPCRRSSVPGASFARCAWLNQTTFSSTPAPSTTMPSTTLRFRRRVGRTRMRASLQRTVASSPTARSAKLAASSQSR